MGIADYRFSPGSFLVAAISKSRLKTVEINICEGEPKKRPKPCKLDINIFEEGIMLLKHELHNLVD